MKLLVFRTNHCSDWRAVAALSFVTILYLYLFSGLKDVDLGKPVAFMGDVITAYFYAHNAAIYGDAYTNPNIGVPFPQELFLFPQRDPIGGYAQAFLGLFTDNAFRVLNLYTIACFIVSAVAFFVSARMIQAPRWLAASAAVCFAFVAYTNVAIDHSVLMPVAAAPIGVVIALLAVRESSLTRREITFVLIGTFAVGSTIPYWTFFACILVASLGAMVAVGRGSWKPLIRPSLIIGGLIASFGIGWAPTLLRTWLSGYASTAGDKVSSQQHLLGLNFLDLLVPKESSLWPLSLLSEAFSDDRLPHIGPIEVYVGVAGTAGLIVIFFQLCRGVAGRGVVASGPETRHYLATLLIISLLFSAAGGLFYVFGAAITPLFRSSFRVSVFITAIALFALILWASNMPRYTRIGVAALCLLSAWERASALHWDTQQQAALVSSEYLSHRAVCREAQRVLPAGTAVMQLPSFPYWDGEPPVHGFQIYSHLSCPIFTPELRWSFGQIAKSPQGEYARYIGSLSPEEIVKLAPTLGFGAILIDHRAYPDGGAEIVDKLAVAGEVVAADDILTLAILEEAPSTPPALPVVLDYRELGFAGPEQDGSDRWRWSQELHKPAAVNVCNYRDGDASIRIEGSVLPWGQDGWVEIDSEFFTWRGRTSQRFEGEANLSPGCHKLWFRGEPQQLRLMNFTIDDI